MMQDFVTGAMQEMMADLDEINTQVRLTIIDEERFQARLIGRLQKDEATLTKYPSDHRAVRLMREYITKIFEMMDLHHDGKMTTLIFEAHYHAVLQIHHQFAELAKS